MRPRKKSRSRNISSQSRKEAVTGVVIDPHTLADTQNLPAVGADASGQDSSLGWPSHTLYRPSRGQGQKMVTITKDPEEPEPESPIDFLGAITVDEAHPPPPQWVTPLMTIMVPAGCLRFVPVQFSTKQNDQWVVNRSFSARPAREWIIPNCLMRVKKANLYVPVLNLGKQPLRWGKSSRLTTVEPLEGRLSNLPDETFGVYNVNEASHTPIPEAVKKSLNVGEDLSTDQRGQLFRLLDRYADCFNADAESIPAHGVEHRIDTGDARPIGSALRRSSAFRFRFFFFYLLSPN